MTGFEEIYREYFRDVYLYILGISKNEQIAEDVTQDTFFKAMKAIDDFHGECDIRVWLCQIAKNEYFSFLRKQKKVVHIGSESEEQWEMQISNSLNKSGEKSIERQIVDQETAELIHQILHEMQEPYKEVFHLRVFGELSFQQIGKIFGKTENWACVTYHRAKMKIQKEMVK